MQPINSKAKRCVLSFHVRNRLTWKETRSWWRKCVSSKGVERDLSAIESSRRAIATSRRMQPFVRRATPRIIISLLGRCRSTRVCSVSIVLLSLSERKISSFWRSLTRPDTATTFPSKFAGNPFFDYCLHREIMNSAALAICSISEAVLKSKNKEERKETDNRSRYLI